MQETQKSREEKLEHVRMASKEKLVTNEREEINTRISQQEEIVITGLAGKYAESDNVHEFEYNLYNKVDMVTEDRRRWDVKHPEIPARAGKIPTVNKFDAGFFGN